MEQMECLVTKTIKVQSRECKRVQSKSTKVLALAVVECVVKTTH